MPDLTPRENYLRALRHEETEYVPFAMAPDIARVGTFSPTDRGLESYGFRDGYGVRWAISESALGGSLPAPGDFILKDVTRWKKDITIPDVSKYDWPKIVEAERAAFPADKKTQSFNFGANCGIWERLAALMGFEEAMIALVEEPEAVNDLFTAITDHKIRLAEVAKKYFDADVFVNYDDVATERQLFMSPDTYRALIKPHHKRLNDAVRNLGMIPIQHTCGHAELCVEDYIETGANGWNALQPSNDLVSLLNNYGAKFVFEGGYDTTGKPGWPTATIDEIVAEVERCFREYGGKKGYIFSGLVLASAGNTNNAAQTQALMDTATRLRFAGK
jgi:uroporphyrinogen-III decarboxylase